MNFNTIRNNNSNTTFDQEVIAGQNDKASQHIYLSGNGLFSTLKLFENQDGQGKQTLKDLRDNNWVINEANLVLYVDQDQYSPFDRSQFQIGCICINTIMESRLLTLVLIIR